MARKYPTGSIVFFAVVLISIIFPIASALAEDLCQRPDERLLVEHNCYRNSNGNEWHSPAHPKNPNYVPPGATATCRDGSYSFSQHHSGTCSSHHGVAKWLR